MFYLVGEVVFCVVDILVMNVIEIVVVGIWFNKLNDD